MATKTSQLGLTKPAYTDAADIAVLNGNFDLIDKAVGNGARVVNLLDNSWFVNPINQRGQTVYTGIGYTIDRWRTWGEGNITVGNGYISASQSLWQYVANIDASKTHTAAICLADGRKYVYSGIPNNGGMGEWGNTIFCGVENGGVFFRIEDNMDDNIVWAALYEGAYTADTLPAYVYKGYAAELAECQRYYLHVGSSYSDWLTVSYAQGWGIIMEIPSPMTMRATPSAVVLDEGIKVFLSSGWTAANSIAVSTYRRGGSVFLLLSGTNGAIGLDAGKTYLAAGLAGLSADL